MQNGYEGMICHNCNAPLETQARFCVRCGARVSTEQEKNLRDKIPDQRAATSQAEPQVNGSVPAQRAVKASDATQKAEGEELGVPTVPVSYASAKKQVQQAAAEQASKKDSKDAEHTSKKDSQDKSIDPLKPKKLDRPVKPPRRPTITPANTAAPAKTLEPANPATTPSHPKRDAGITPPDLHETPLIVPGGVKSSYPGIPREPAFYEVPTVDVNLKTPQPEVPETESSPAPHSEPDPPAAPADIATVPFAAPRVPHPELANTDDEKEYVPEGALLLSSEQPSQPLLYYRLNTTTKGSQMLPAVINTQTKRRRGGCFLGCLTTFVILLLVLGAAWVFALRPYAHGIAETQLNHALTSAVNQIPNTTSRLPSGITVPIGENAINNLIVLNLAPSNPVQHPNTTISRQNIRLDFQLYGYPCAITAVPQVNNGRLVVTNVNTEGIFAAIMSPDEMSTILNRHLNDAQGRLGRTINNVQLKDHEADLTLG